MRIALICAGLVLGVALYGCGSSSGRCTAGCAGSGASAGEAGTAGAAGAAGSIGAAGAAGSAGAAGAAGTGGEVGCNEPAPCEGYDNAPDAHLSATVTCLTPSTAATNVAFTLAVYGHHLAIGPTDYAIVTVGGAALNGVPASACHLDVAVPASAVAGPGQVPVVVSPGGWTLASSPMSLTVH